MTSTHDWYEAHLEAYVLRTLADDEQQAFDDHLRRCERCRAAVDALEAGLAPLAYGVRPVPVPPGLRKRIADAVLAGDATERRRRWSAAAVAPWLMAAAAVLVAAGVTARSAGRAATLQQALAAAEGRATVLADSLAAVTRTTRVRQARFAGAGGEGGMVVLADDAAHRWRVVVHGPAAPDGMSYLVCFITPTGLVHAVTVGKGGAPVSFTLGMPSDGTQVLGAALLLEHDQPSPGAPVGHTPIAEVRL